MDVDTTPVPTEAVQPTESAEPTAPTETETPEVTEAPEPTPENPAATDESTQGEPTAEPTDEGIMPANVMPVQANVAARDISKDGFIRIFHLDCGRKYFSVSEIEGIIDQLAANNYTHIQLAFGNDGFRFILKDMSVTVGDKTYGSDTVKNAITRGNSIYSSSMNTASTTLSQSNMDDIISYAKSKSIGVIPMLNTPGHMHALVSAMQMLDIRSTTGSEMDLTSETEVNFIKALQQKYITYFAGKGSDHYNFAADEYSFSNLDNTKYTKFAEYVNALANMVKKANMTPMAYNDGIYYSGKTTSVNFDTDIQICYWSQATNYASVTELAEKGFQIINNNDAWYYVLGDYLYEKWSSGQWGYQDALDGIKNTPVTQAKNATDRAIELAGSVLCCWCDGPSIEYTGTRVNKGNAPANQTNKESVYALIKAMADANPDYFKKEAVNVPAVEISENGTNVKTTKETVDGKTVYKAAVKADGTSKIQLKVVNIDNTVNWASDKNEIATVDGNGLVIFKGAAGTVTITATPVAATRSNTEPATYSITFNVTREGEVTEETIEVAVGKTETVIIKGENLARDEGYTTDDPSIATVNVTGVNAGESTTKYELANSVKVTDIANSNSNGNYLSTDYFYLKDGAYYPLYVTRSYSTYTYYTYTYYLKDNSGQYQRIGDQQVYSWNLNSTNCNIKLYNATTTTTTETSTTIEFTGLKENQTTYVTIGNIRYKIVVKADLTNAPKLPVQLWITNVSIEVTGVTKKTSSQFNDYSNGGYGEYILAEAESAYGKDGVPLSSLVPPAVKNKAVTIFDDRDANYSIWKGVVLNTTTGLQKYWSTDMTMAEGCVDYQYVRYFDSKWEVSADRVNWTVVTGEGSTDSPKSCKEQVIAYYTQRTNVTNEILTDVVDWGNTTEEWNKEHNNGNPITQYAVLDFAVQYPTERIPNTFPVKGKSVYYHCDQTNTNVVHKDSNGNYYRRIGLIKGIDTTNYEVYMITVTPTSDTPTDQLTDANTGLTPSINLNYNGTEKVVWVDDEANLPVAFRSADAKYKSISGKFEYSVGGNPNVAGLEIYQRQGMLVTYYLRPKVTTDTLHVYYIDKDAGKKFYDYPINVISPIVFDANIGLAEIWKGPLANGTVKNDMGKDQTVSADLSTMPAISAQYRYGNYECVEVTHSTDCKNVYLYYTFRPEKTFVVDFGLPLNIKPTDVSKELEKANITAVQYDKSYYATITEGEGFSINYTLTTTIGGVDNFQIVYKGTNLATQEDGTATFTIRIIPATNVYYEDSFAKFTDGSGTATGATWTPVYDTNITAENNPYANTTQALEALGTKKNVYGYDPKYDSCSMFSMGSARKVTVTSTMATTGVVWPTAQFTFKGTGFDIISLTDNTSGAIFVDVTRKVNGEEVKERSVFVDNYYGYSYENGTWKAEPNNPNAIYQVPVIKVSGLDYDEHKVVIKVAYNTFFDDANAGSYSFWLDAVRVYDPAGNTLDNDYVKDREVKPIYVEVRKALIKQGSFTGGNENIAGAVFIDGKADGATIDDYKNFGPNHEVYLAGNQAIAFRIVANREPATVQIGVKLANGSNGTLKIGGGNEVKFAAYSNVNASDTLTLSTATDMYYALDGITWTEKNGSQESNVIVLTNTGDNSIVSITNVKCTYASITENTTNAVTLAISYDDALMAVDAVNSAITPVEPEPEPEPEKTFEPDRFEASWSRNVMQGRKATLTVKTSEDVEAITVDGQTIRSYRTRSERVGFGRRAKRITYREFTYSMVAQETADFSVTAINAEGTESEAITARLTVKTRPNSMRDMWDWFKGWF